jgi:TATA-box binding protein (TBP) (component of TFIID and TFIIIB)
MSKPFFIQLLSDVQRVRMFVNVTNIKVSIKLESQSLDSVENKIKNSVLSYKKYNNFIVIKDFFVYTIFRSGKNNFNHVNITKIKHFSKVEEAIEKLKNLDFNINKKSLKIDNITGSIDLEKEVQIENIIKRVSSNASFSNLKISYNNEKFPGLFLKLKSVGTIIIFHSGKVVFVGCKTVENLECLASLSHVLTKIN